MYQVGRSEEPPASLPPAVGGWHQLGAGLLVACLLALQLRAMLGPHEDWPFTSAPMFARYHTMGEPLFELRVFARLAGGDELEVVPARDLGIGELAFRRQLFSRHYGSVDPKNPGGHRAGDNPELFRERLKNWMGRVSRAYSRSTGRELASLRLEVRRLARGRTEARSLAELQLSSGELSLSPLPGAP